MHTTYLGKQGLLHSSDYSCVMGKSEASVKTKINIKLSVYLFMYSFTALMYRHFYCLISLFSSDDFLNTHEFISFVFCLKGFNNDWTRRDIFQTFWKLHCCTKSLFLELETSNFDYLFIFWFFLTLQSFSKIGQHWY